MTSDQKALAEKSLEKAFELLGGVTETARRLGVYQGRVSNWRTAKHVSRDMVRELAKLVSPRVTEAQLRPDIYGKA